MIIRDGFDDYLVVDSKTGALKAYLNQRATNDVSQISWGFESVGTIATGLGPGKNVRIADIDGDGVSHGIPSTHHPVYGCSVCKLTSDLLASPHSVMIISISIQTVGPPSTATSTAQPPPTQIVTGLCPRQTRLALGSGRRKSNSSTSMGKLNDVAKLLTTYLQPWISDGKADYVWTRPVDGRVEVWLNMYPALPAWHAIGEIAGGVGTSGTNVRYGRLQAKERADYIAVDPSTGSIAAWLNGCDDPDKSSAKNIVTILRVGILEDTKGRWTAYPLDSENAKYCTLTSSTGNAEVNLSVKFPTEITGITAHGHNCSYHGKENVVGQLLCDGVSAIHCSEDTSDTYKCTKYGVKMSFFKGIICKW